MSFPVRLMAWKQIISEDKNTFFVNDILPEGWNSSCSSEHQGLFEIIVGEIIVKSPYKCWQKPRWQVYPNGLRGMCRRECTGCTTQNEYIYIYIYIYIYTYIFIYVFIYLSIRPLLLRGHFCASLKFGIRLLLLLPCLLLVFTSLLL